MIMNGVSSIRTGPILRTGLVNTGLVLSVVTRIDNLPIFETEFGQIGVGSRPGPLKTEGVHHQLPKLYGIKSC